MSAPLLLVSSAFLLALGSVLAKILLAPNSTAMHPLFFLVAQLAGGLLILFTFAIATRQLVWTKELQQLVLPGLIIGVGSICTILALYFTTASEASLIFATQPAIVLGLAWVFLKEQITWSTTVLILVAVVGVFTIVQAGGAGVSLNRTYGIASAVFSTTCAAIYVVWMRRATHSVSPIMALITVQLVAFVVSVAAWVAWQMPGISQIRIAPVTTAAVTGVIYYGAAFLMYLHGLRRIEASQAGIYLSLVPVFTIALAFVWLDEALTYQQLGGGMMVVLAVAGVAMLAARAKME